MNTMKEKFASMSGDTMSGLTGLFDGEDLIVEDTEVNTTEETDTEN
jgi:hypothetical protein